MPNVTNYQLKKYCLALAMREADLRLITSARIIERAIIYQAFMQDRLVIGDAKADVIQFPRK